MSRKTFVKLCTAMIAVSVLFLVSACEKKNKNTLIVGATPEPHARLLNFVKDDFKKKGYVLDVVEFTDYVTPNAAVLDGSIDANFFQHVPYLEERSEWRENLTPIISVHIEPFALYSAKYSDITQLPDGATIAVPNDPTNGGRAFLLLEANGLITLKDGADLTATELDIIENPRNLKFIALDAAQLARTLVDVDAACINGNYALQAQLNPTTDSLLIEGADSPYVNVIVVKNENKNDPRIKALEEVLITPKVRKFIEDTWSNGSVIAIF